VANWRLDALLPSAFTSKDLKDLREGV